ncbi:unnamed protein product [Trifolium pratense]|uniref:Uncharacterized protein n=1 Tax=Trifolium pratense TaxID=57577 RepID=A0ACB0KAT2_TRIPR|nr:unnamed protein product [Trifolium pratense]
MENNKNNYFARRNHFFLSVSNDRDSSLSLTTDSDSVFEFEESDIYTSNHANSTEFHKSIHGSRSVKKQPSSKVKDAGAYVGGAPASMPVNIPDWSKILGDEYTNNYMKKNGMEEEDEDEDEDDGWLPPHEFLARTRVASFSVHEGIGRTLKGRDLSRLRNEIWAKTGFQ